MLSADALMSTGQGILGFNMYAYCLNNPLIMSDPSGFWAQTDNTDSGNPDNGKRLIYRIVSTMRAIAAAISAGASSTTIQWIGKAGPHFGTSYPPEVDGKYPRVPGTMDCSELAYAMVSETDPNFPNTTRKQIKYLNRDAAAGYGVAGDEWTIFDFSGDLSELQPGDLVYFSKEKGRPCHVAMYCGNGYIIDATDTGGGVAFRPIGDYQLYNPTASYFKVARYSG